MMEKDFFQTDLTCSYEFGHWWNMNSYQSIADSTIVQDDSQRISTKFCLQNTLAQQRNCHNDLFQVHPGKWTWRWMVLSRFCGFQLGGWFLVYSSSRSLFRGVSKSLQVDFVGCLPSTAKTTWAIKTKPGCLRYNILPSFQLYVDYNKPWIKDPY